VAPRGTHDSTVGRASASAHAKANPSPSPRTSFLPSFLPSFARSPRRLAHLAEAGLARLLDADNACGLLQFADTYLAASAAPAPAPAPAPADEAAAAAGAAAGAGAARASPGALLRSACVGLILREFARLAAGEDFAALSAPLRRELRARWRSGGHAFVLDRGRGRGEAAGEGEGGAEAEAEAEEGA
jgi:hypothetical protein